MVLLPSAFMFIGGGIMIVRVISVSAVADISTEETRLVERISIETDFQNRLH